MLPYSWRARPQRAWLVVLEGSKAKSSFQQRRKLKKSIEVSGSVEEKVKKTQKSVTIFLKGENLENMVISVRKVKDKKFVWNRKQKKKIEVFWSVEKKVKEIWKRRYNILEGVINREDE